MILDAAQDDSIRAVQEGWSRLRPDLPTRSVPVVSLVWSISRALHARRAAVLADAGIDQATLELLANLRREPELQPLAPSVLAARCGVTAAAITLRIRRAEASGWVRRDPSPADGRSVLVSLTDAGVEVAERLAEQVLLHDHQLVAPLSNDELSSLEQLLRRWAASMGPLT